MALKTFKSGKAAGADEILPTFLKFLGPKGRNWLSRLVTAVAKTCNIPKLCRATNLIPLLKSGK